MQKMELLEKINEQKKLLEEYNKVFEKTNEFLSVIVSINERINKTSIEIESGLMNYDDSENVSGEQAYWDKRMSVLAEVWTQGEVVSTEDWHKIGNELGYDTRGLGGFFAGDNSGMFSSDTKKMITRYGKDMVRTWLKDGIGEFKVKPSKQIYNKYKHLIEEN